MAVEVQCSNKKLYAGRTNKKMFVGKMHDVTNTAPVAVAIHLILCDEYLEFEYKGNNYRLSVTKLD